MEKEKARYTAPNVVVYGAVSKLTKNADMDMADVPNGADGTGACFPPGT